MTVDIYEIVEGYFSLCEKDSLRFHLDQWQRDKKLRIGKKHKVRVEEDFEEDYQGTIIKYNFKQI